MKKNVIINKGTIMNPYNPSSFPCMISIAGKYSNGDKYFNKLKKLMLLKSKISFDENKVRALREEEIKK